MTESTASNARWYVVHTYSGHENKVKKNIEKMVENRGMEDQLEEVSVPMEEVVEVKDGKRVVKERKKFPGYVLVKMIMNDKTWYIVRNTAGVTGFVGPGSKPIPLTDEEMRRMGLQEVVSVDFVVGDQVKVMSGPFENFMGAVESINNDQQKVKVYISMFGRETLTELTFSQVEKL